MAEGKLGEGKIWRQRYIWTTPRGQSCVTDIQRSVGSCNTLPISVAAKVLSNPLSPLISIQINLSNARLLRSPKYKSVCRSM